MKTFLGIEIPVDISQQIIVQTSQLRKDYPAFDWVPSEHFYISLYYSGDIPESKLDIAVEHIQRSVFDIPPTHLFSFGAGIYIHKSISLYISFQKNNTIKLLHERFVELFEDKKKDFEPIITIANWKIPSKQQYLLLKKKLLNLPIEINFPIKEIHLYESISKEKHSKLHKIHSFKLEE